MFFEGTSFVGGRDLWEVSAEEEGIYTAEDKDGHGVRMMV